MANDENFAQDITESQVNGNTENGGGDSQQETSAEAPGRDDDRYSSAPSLAPQCAEGSSRSLGPVRPEVALRVC